MKKSIIYNLKFWIVVIGLVILLSVLYYSWTSCVFCTLTTTAEPVINQQTVLKQQIIIESAKYYEGHVIAVIRNVGTGDIDTSKLSIGIDGLLHSNYTANPTGKLGVGNTSTIDVKNATSACPNKILLIAIETGLTSNKTIDC